VQDSTLVSVIIPTYNCAQFLAPALESVAAQSYRPLEVIVIDDGSTDRTEAVVTAFLRRTGLPGCYHFQHNQGPSAARNHGLTLARGAWVAFQDADDVWLPGKTAHQMQVLASHPDAGIAWGNALPFQGDIAPEITFADSSTATLASLTMWMVQSTLMRREVLDEVGPFDPALRLGEDVDWMLRAMERSVQIVVDHELVVYYRRHTTNLTGDAAMTQRAFHYVLKRSLDRRRQQGESALPPALMILPRNRPAPVNVQPARRID
jgi:glycosyltransferase involved in cell wall biosynthesis